MRLYYKNLNTLKDITKRLEDVESLLAFKKAPIDLDQSKVVTFSDSIIIFSKGDSYNDAHKIFHDCYRLLQASLENNISIKGAISFGETTVDFENSLFFGKPIIDAYLLHEDLEMLTVVLDNNAEVKLDSYEVDKAAIKFILADYKANMKSGKITHKLIKTVGEDMTTKRINALKELYKLSHGRPRIYIDNTIDFLNWTIIN
jgi:hypothetical protein